MCGDETDGPLPPAAALAALGRPSSEEAFPLSGALTEFRVRLLRRGASPDDAGVRIRERTWADGPCRLTVWLAERRDGLEPVDWLRWREGDVF